MVSSSLARGSVVIVSGCVSPETNSTLLSLFFLTFNYYAIKNLHKCCRIQNVVLLKKFVSNKIYRPSF